MARDDILQVTAQIVSAHIASNKSSIQGTVQLIRYIHATLAALKPAGDRSTAHPSLTPAVPIAESIADTYLVCLEDGARVKVLKRYLRRFGLTTTDYRKKWGLPADYPMVAPAYSKMRRRMAKEIGLGTKRMRKAKGTRRRAGSRKRPRRSEDG